VDLRDCLEIQEKGKSPCEISGIRGGVFEVLALSKDVTNFSVLSGMDVGPSCHTFT